MDKSKYARITTALLIYSLPILIIWKFTDPFPWLLWFIIFIGGYFFIQRLVAWLKYYIYGIDDINTDWFNDMRNKFGEAKYLELLVKLNKMMEVYSKQVTMDTDLRKYFDSKQVILNKAMSSKSKMKFKEINI